jgi:hypothetical protein
MGRPGFLGTPAGVHVMIGKAADDRQHNDVCAVARSNYA